jgi:sterol 3beta-glucosyltransferase
MLAETGDLDPYLALAAALRAAGAEPCIVTHQSFASQVKDGGVAFYSLGPGLLERRRDSAEGAALNTARSTAKLPAARKFMAAVLQESWRLVDAAFEAFRPDFAVLSTLAVFAISSLCDKRGVPWAAAHLCPLVPTRYDAPSVGGLTPSSISPAYNAWLWRITTRMGWRLVYADAVNALRAGAGMPPIAHDGGAFGMYCGADRHTALLYSPSLSGAPADCPPSAAVLGACLPAADAGGLPAEVSAFLDAADARPVVAICFGSMLQALELEKGAGAASKLLQTAARAALDAGARVVMQTQGASPSSLPAWPVGDVLQASYSLPHALLFARARAVVCHGGCGTVHAVLRAGTPPIVVAVLPDESDQPYWGRKVVQAGAAPAWFMAGGLRPAALAAALRACLVDGEPRRHAAAMGVAMAAENGGVACARFILSAAGRGDGA